MAHYLIRDPEDGDSAYHFVEAANAREAVSRVIPKPGDRTEVDLWVLRHGEPRRYVVRTETKTVIEQDRDE